MKVILRFPDRTEFPVKMSHIPKSGENIEFAGNRFLVASVVHGIERGNTVLELLRLSPEEGYRTIHFNELARYRTSEIRAYSPVMRPRYR